MGGFNYERDVTGYTGVDKRDFDYAGHRPDGTTADSTRALASRSLDTGLLPKNRRLVCTHLSPVILAVDVTGSMGDWPKIIWDKLPMFWGQIIEQGYLKDPSVCFAAIGDVHSDKAPLQVCDFAESSALDAWLARIWLEGGGGGQGMESYELMAYYLRHHLEYPAGSRPIIIFTGDEGFYPSLDLDEIQERIGAPLPQHAAALEEFSKLRKIADVFLIHKTYSDDPPVLRQWQEALGAERVVTIDDPKAVVDTALGFISLVTRARSLSSYAADMQARDQSAQRITQVTAALKPLADSMVMVRAADAGPSSLTGPSGGTRRGSKRL